MYLDEIQYFNKKQQQSLLEFIETGKITLIASTTENPYFYIYNAILSRCTVFEFKPVEAADMRRAVERALKLAMGEDAKPVEDGVVDYIAQAVGGDVRKALGAVELLVSGAGDGRHHARGCTAGGAALEYALTTATATAIMTSCRRCRSPCAAPTRTRRCIISRGCSRQAI